MAYSSETTFIYCLIDPKDNQPKYIGKSNNPIYRLNYGHLSEYNIETSKTIMVSWLRSLKKRGFKPILDIIDEVPFGEWQFWEKHYISLYKSWGFDLKNGTIGGEGFESGILNPAKNPEVRKILSKQKLGDLNPSRNPEVVMGGIKTREQNRIAKHGIPPYFYKCPNPSLNVNCKGKTFIYIKYCLYNKAVKQHRMCKSCARLGKLPWNKELTKETSQGVKSAADFKIGKKRSFITKQKISIQLLKRKEMENNV